MAILTAFKLKFQSPIHIGTARADYDTSETIQHSDTLYAALTSACFSLGMDDKKAKEILNAAGDLKGITLSSLFPFYYSKNGTEFFFPIPLGSVEPAEIDFHKELKKAKFVDLFYFKKIQREGKVEIPKSAINGQFISKDMDFDESFMTKQVFPRAKVPRSGKTGDTKIYYIERTFFRSGSGLFCLAFLEDKLAYDRLKALFNYLGDEGIGTDRNVGHGFFDVEEENEIHWQELLDINASYSTNLSLFLPENPDQLSWFLDSESKYKILKRGGWITTSPYLTYRKNSIHMFQEGGIFKHSLSIAGKTEDLKPTSVPGWDNNKSIYRSGKSLFVPINLT